MVKRQTVWLSTMMVLSLMLIGYYTMNNQTSPTSATGTSIVSPDNTTTATSAQSASATGSGSTDASLTSSSASGTSTGSSTPSDWFVAQATTMQNQFSATISRLQADIANPNTATAQLTTDETSLDKVQTLKGSIENAEELVKGNGYTDCVIVTDPSYEKVNVYVKASKLSTADAVKIMNLVNQTTDISLLNINVTPHS